jgi:REP element-mobilizing transposase RayT
MQVVMDGHGGAYVVRAAVVMPNHVHLVLTMAVGSTLAKVMQQIKGASAHSVNQLLGRRGRLWQPEYFDRVVRDAEHLHRCIHYVHWNPVKARLCVDPRHYAMSTANPSYANAIEGGGLKSADPDAD